MAVAQGDFADFVGGPTNICQGEVVNFNDTSSGVISTWDWNFPGGTPSSSTDQNPVITYNAAGIYDVILTVGNGTEIDSETKTGFVTVMAGTTFYLDSDADGYGDVSNSIVECSPVPPAGYSENSLDCDDTNSNISPEAPETCNGIDDNCNGTSDEGLALVTYYADEDSDGFGDDLVSQDSCDGGPIGYVTVGGDCDDSNDNVYAGAPGTREGLDNDCDGDIEGDEIYVCIGDINSDGMVNIYDLTGLLGDFGCSENCYADLDFDGNVSTGDIAIFLSVFGSLCE
jgi:PKD repeat protein